MAASISQNNANVANRLDRLPMSSIHRTVLIALAFAYFFELGDISTFSFSSTKTRSTRSRAAKAAESAALPEPTTTTSYPCDIPVSPRFLRAGGRIKCRFCLKERTLAELFKAAPVCQWSEETNG